MKHIIGIDIGGTKIAVVLGTERGHIREKHVLKTGVRRATEQSIQELIATVRRMLTAHALTPASLLGIGVCVPGTVDPACGVITHAPNLPGWNGRNIKQLLARTFRCRVVCDNDAKTACCAEKMFGQGKGVDDFVYMTISTGIGSGLILNNELVYGAGFSAGEIGHIPLEPDGPQCGCGKYGCLEAVASGSGIARIVHDVLAEKRRGIRRYCSEYAYTQYRHSHDDPFARTASLILRQWKNHGTTLDSREIARAARSGDRLARYAFWRAGYYCGMGMATLMQLCNPAVIALGGSVINAGALYLTSMRAALREHTWPAVVRRTRIVTSQLGSRVADVGVISLVLFQQAKR